MDIRQGDFRRQVKLVKVGSSLVFRIPANICHSFNLKRGDYFDLLISDENTIIARRLKVVASDNIEGRKDDTLPKINYE